MRSLTSLGVVLSLFLGAAVFPVAPETPQTLRGTVVAADGTPAAGAVVWTAKVEHGPLVRVEATADAQGRFALDVHAGRWYVWAKRGVQGGEVHDVAVTPNRAPNDVTIRLAERGTLRGRLLEAETGRPVGGGRFALDNGEVLTTDADGRFSTSGLKRAGHEAFVVAPGRARIRVLFDTTARADAELDVSVRQGGRIVGRVLDGDGRPIPGAFVGRATSGTFFSINGLYERCDEQGRFAYDGAPLDQPTWLGAGAPGCDAPDRSGLLVEDANRPLEVTFRLTRRPAEGQPAAPGVVARRAVTGVVRAAGGAPVENARIRWGALESSGSPETRTGPDGRFRLADVPDEEGLVTVLAAAFCPAFPHVAAGGERHVEVGLESGDTARGVVVDDTGTPLVGVWVNPAVPSPDPEDHRRVLGGRVGLSEHGTRTDHRGRFELKGLPGDAVFYFSRDGLNAVSEQRLEFGEPENRVVMKYVGALRGRELDAAGRPVRSFRVLIDIPRQRGPQDQVGGYFAGYNSPGVSFTSEDGTFTVTKVEAGFLHRVAVVADGHGAAVEDRVEALPLNRPPPAGGLTLRLGLARRLRVRVVAGTTPLAGAHVTLVHGKPDLDTNFAWGYDDISWSESSRARTAADGWAEFPALAYGEATVLVQAPGHARQRFGWRTGAPELMAVLAPEAALALDARDAAGQPLRQFYVNLEGGGDQFSAAAGPDDNGRVRLAELPAGAFTLMVRDGTGRTTIHQGPVTLTAGETLTQTIHGKKD